MIVLLVCFLVALFLLLLLLGLCDCGGCVCCCLHIIHIHIHIILIYVVVNEHAGYVQTQSESITGGTCSPSAIQLLDRRARPH